jgi:hypothetical protein
MHGENINEIDSMGGTVTITYSDIQGGYAGTGNIATDPKFVDAAHGNLRLKTGSACIDQGTSSGVPVADEDLDHNPRVVDGNGEGLPTIDMGAYEYQTTATVAALVAPSGTIPIKMPTYTWNAVYNCTWYYLYVEDSTGNKVKLWSTAAQAGCSSGAGTCSLNPEIVLEKGTAKWWVQTYNPKGLGPWSSGMMFNVEPIMPGKVTLVSPSELSTTNIPTYTWNKDANTTSYRLYVNDSTGNRVSTWYSAAQSCSGNVCTASPGIALAKGSAAWWVQGWNSNGYGDWSKDMTFTVPGPVMPGKAAPVSPLSITTATNWPSFTWNVASNASWYRLYINDNTGKLISTWHSAAQSCSDGTCSASPGIALAKGSVAWWVQSWSPNGYGDWSDAGTFTSPAPALPGKVALISPSGTNSTSIPTYTWNRDANTTWYLLYVNDSTGNRVNNWYSAAQSCSGGTCSASPDIALAQGSATWWIDGWNPNGTGPWSNGMSFTLGATSALKE